MKKKSIRSGSALNKSVCPLSMWNWFVALQASSSVSSVLSV